MRNEKSRSGFTLSEMIVASSVLGLFIMLGLGTVVPSLKITRAAEQSLAAQREVVLTFDRLVAEMGPLDQATVTVNTDTLSFLSDQEYQGSNEPLPDTDLVDLGVSTFHRTWQKNVILRRRDGDLWRREYPYTKGSALFQTLPERLPIIGDIPGVAEKIYARNVELFEVTPAGRSRVFLKVRSVFREQKRPVACELKLQIQMRGGL